MSQVNTNAIYDASGGQSAQLYGVSMRYGGTNFVNRIINGDMRIDQRNAGASVTPTNGQYLVDRWFGFLSAASKYSFQQNSGAVTPPTGFNNYVGAVSLSAYSVGAAESFGIAQNIEGFNAADLAWGTANAQSATLSFWVRSSLTGTFGGSLRNDNADRSYPFSYTISAANTWEYKTVAVSGPTSGTWVVNNGIGIRLAFSLGAGADRSGTAGTWNTSNNVSATGATSVVGTNGATFYITGVQLEAGSVATPFERRPYGTELALCQRYFELARGIGFARSTDNIIIGSVGFKVEKRATPTVVATKVVGAGSGALATAYLSTSACLVYQAVGSASGDADYQAAASSEL